VARAVGAGAVLGVADPHGHGDVADRGGDVGAPATLREHRLRELLGGGGVVDVRLRLDAAAHHDPAEHPQERLAAVADVGDGARPPAARLEVGGEPAVERVLPAGSDVGTGHGPQANERPGTRRPGWGGLPCRGLRRPPSSRQSRCMGRPDSRSVLGTLAVVLATAVLTACGDAPDGIDAACRDGATSAGAPGDAEIVLAFGAGVDRLTPGVGAGVLLVYADGAVATTLPAEDLATAHVSMIAPGFHGEQPGSYVAGTLSGCALAAALER